MKIFLAGLAMGLALAVAGACMDYFLYLRDDRARSGRKPALLIWMALLLAVMGAVAILSSLAVAGRVSPALVMGLGVLSGFYGGFIVLLLLWLARTRR